MNVLNVQTLEFVKKMDPPHYDGVSTICSVSDTLLLSASRDKVVKLWNVGTGDILQEKKIMEINAAHQDWINALCKHEQTIFSACRDGTIAAWNPETLNQIASVQVHYSSVNSLVSAGRFLFSGSNDRTAKMWKIGELPTSVLLSTSEEKL